VNYRAKFLVVVLAAVLVSTSEAYGHGGGAAEYRSTVEALTPPTPGLELSVVDRDDRLRLVNGTGRGVTVLGYEGEPYLRFEGGRVLENGRSPAAYLNDDRYARVPLPKRADPEAAPEWRQVATGTSFEWHDHRIHWMSPDAPPSAVRDDPDSRHRVLEWEVPLLVGGEPATFRGRLDYLPGGRPLWQTLLAILGAVFLLAVGAATFWTSRRRRVTL